VRPSVRFATCPYGSWMPRRLLVAKLEQLPESVSDHINQPQYKEGV